MTVADAHRGDRGDRGRAQAREFPGCEVLIHLDPEGRVDRPGNDAGRDRRSPRKPANDRTAPRPGRRLRRPAVHRQSGGGDAARRTGCPTRCCRRSRWRTISARPPSRSRRDDGEADYELRWFTPTAEVVLCGHATLASGHVLIGDGRPHPLPHPPGRHARSGARRRRLRHVAAGLEGRAEAAARRRSPRLAARRVETLWHAGRYALVVLDERGRGARAAARFPRAGRRGRHRSPSSPRPATRPTWSAASSPPAPASTRIRSPARPTRCWCLTGPSGSAATALTAFQASRARRPSHRPPRRRPRHPRRQMRHGDRRGDADLIASPRARNHSPQIRRSGIPFSSFSVKNRNGCGGVGRHVEHPDRRGRAVVRPDAQTSRRAEPAVQRHRGRRGQRRRRSPRSRSGCPISPSSISSSPTARPAFRSR